MGAPVAAVPLRWDRSLIIASLAAITVLCWAWSLSMAAEMGAASMGAHAHHAHHGHGTALWPLFAMWAVMMVGMMIPPEAAVLFRLAGGAVQVASPWRVSAAFLAGYLAPWVLFSLGAAVLQLELSSRGLMDAQMATSSPILGGVLLVAAGAVQLSPLKRACIDQCRATGRVPGGMVAAARLGLRNSALSVGSCGVLMLVLFVTGVMSVPWMLAITAWLVIERFVPPRYVLHGVAGVVLIGWGAWKLLT